MATAIIRIPLWRWFIVHLLSHLLVKFKIRFSNAKNLIHKSVTNNFIIYLFFFLHSIWFFYSCAKMYWRMIFLQRDSRFF